MLAGCPAPEDDSCRLDSDCEAGLICHLGVCATPGAVADALANAGANYTEDASATEASALAEVAASADADQVECKPPSGVFDVAGAAPCPEPVSKRPVTSIEIVKEGGLTNLADLANPLIVNKIADGTIAVALWVDGTLAPGCTWKHAWIAGDGHGISGDCTAKHTTTFPMPVPLGDVGIAVVEGAVYDPVTGVLTGLVDKEQLLEQVPEGLKETASKLVVEDVDTDGDQTPDRASATLIIGLGP